MAAWPRGDRRGSLAPAKEEPTAPRRLTDRQRVDLLLDELARTRAALRTAERLLGLEGEGSE